MESADIGYLLNKAARRLRLDFADRLSASGLRPMQAAALIALGRCPEGRLTPTQLADAVDTDAPTVSGLLARLERDGWVRSTPNPDDGRSRLMAMTPKAVDALPQVLRLARESSDAATACLSVEEARTLERLLSRLCEQRDNQSRQER